MTRETGEAAQGRLGRTTRGLGTKLKTRTSGMNGREGKWCDVQMALDMKLGCPRLADAGCGA